MAYEQLLAQSKKIAETLYIHNQTEMSPQLVDFRADLLALMDENKFLRKEIYRLKALLTSCD